MSEQQSESPKAFISYSWTSPDHEAWVIALATELEESGVHVILDRWDLREGADKYAFMEKMVTDPTIRKVIVVCDRLYAEKADGRKGGVGTETQIISQEVYDQVNPVDQKQKFVAVITEKDEDSKPYIPTFLKSRIYVDMSDSTLRAANFEQLVRWIYDKPLHKRPERGKPPIYLSSEDNINLGTGARFRHALEALKQNKVSALGAVQDYFNTFAENLETLRIQPEEGKEFDDQVVESIEAFLPYRDEVLDLVLTIARFRSDHEMYGLIHSFFERLLPYKYQPSVRTSWREWDADNFNFILNEVFLYTIAALLKNGRFDGVNDLLGQGYYFAGSLAGGPEAGLVPYTFFRGYLKSLEYRNQRLSLRRVSVMSDLLNQRAKRPDLTFNDVMQADLVLYVRDELRSNEENYPFSSWYPHTLLYASHRHTPFEIFARAQSIKYFDQMKTALAITSKDDIVKLIQEFRSGERRLPNWQFDTFNPSALMNIEKLATRP